MHARTSVAWPWPRVTTTQAHGDRIWPGPGWKGTRRSTTRNGDRSPFLSSVPELTPGRKQSPSRTSSSPSRRSTFPNASWSNPSIHPFRKLWQGPRNLNIWSPGLPPPGGGGQANMGRPAPAAVYAAPATVKEYVASSPADTYASPASVTEYASSSFTCHGLCRTYSSD